MRKIKILIFILIIISFFKTEQVFANPLYQRYVQDSDGTWKSITRINMQYNPNLINTISLSKPLNYKNKSATLLFTGDLMCLAGQQFSAENKGRYDFSKSYALVAPLFHSADFVCGNLETLISKSNPITKLQKNIDSAPQCNGPESYLNALRYAGIDCVATANNHCCDWGATGIIETENMLDKHGFAHVGTSKEIKENFVIFKVRDYNVAILSYTHLINQRGKMSSTEMSSMVSQYSPERVQTDILAAKDKGADFVVVYCHWGVENTETLTYYQTNDAKLIAEYGADLIIGSHPHCLQGKDIITTSDGRKVICMYSMGNFVSSMVRDINNDTIILSVQINKDKNGKTYIQNIDYIPCHVLNLPGYSSFTVVPTDKIFNKGRESGTLAAAKERIKLIIGSFNLG